MIVLFLTNAVAAQIGVPFMNPDDVKPDLSIPANIPLVTGCNSSGIGCPYDNLPILYIPVNFHYYLNLDGTGNFNEINDGSSPPNPYNGYQRAEDIVKEANSQLETNDPIFGPNPNNSPSCKINIRLVLGGVYFHRVSNKGTCFDSLETKSLYGPIWNKYEVNPKKEFNVNLQTYTNACPVNYAINKDKGPSGVTPGYGDYRLGVFNDWDAYQYWKGSEGLQGYPLANNAKTLLHELVHTVGLFHPTKGGDECDDTYKFKKDCWDKKDTDPDCDKWGKVSNNLMDYNQFTNWSLTACQVCFIYEAFSGKGGYNQSGLVRRIGGCPPANAFVSLP
ncbi:MAG: hypothetical protein RLZZ628_4091, partial [Bacteroidota bacterium]